MINVFLNLLLDAICSKDLEESKTDDVLPAPPLTPTLFLCFELFIRLQTWNVNKTVITARIFLLRRILVKIWLQYVANAFFMLRKIFIKLNFLDVIRSVFYMHVLFNKLLEFL